MASGFRNDLVDNFPGHGIPVSQIDTSARLSFLRQTYAWTFAGILAAVVGAALSSFFIMANMQLAFAFPYQPIIVMFACMFFSNYFCAGLLRDKSTQVLGLFLANGSMGIALGYLIVFSMMLAKANGDHALAIIGQALGVTLLTVVGITAYVSTTKNDFNWVKSILAALFLPMMFMMVMFVFFDVGGTLGIIFSAVFVAISAIGLLVSTNDVIHSMDESQTIQGAFVLSLGIVILFWNILSLLNRLNR